MAEVKEAEVFAVVFYGDHVFEILVGEVFEGYGDVVGVQEELGEVFEF